MKARLLAAQHKPIDVRDLRDIPPCIKLIQLLALTMNHDEFQKLKAGLLNMKSATLALFTQMTIAQTPHGGYISKEPTANMMA